MQEADIEVMADKYGEEKALGQAAMMLDALEELLKKHDWYYMMSDDNRAYTQGSAQQYEIRKNKKDHLLGTYWIGILCILGQCLREINGQ